MAKLQLLMTPRDDIFDPPVLVVAPPREPIGVLMVAFEGGRWGAARLTATLAASGFEVAALCPDDNGLAATRHVQQHFALPDVLSSRQVETRLVAAIAQWQPSLIIAADERAVACLHAIVRRGSVSPEIKALLVASLAPPENFDAMLFKDKTLEVARRIGVRCPQQEIVTNAAEARAAAARIGMPVFVKTSFSWAGRGVTHCADATAVERAITADGAGIKQKLRHRVKRLLNRDWYPVPTDCAVQQSISGTPAMYCAAVLNGRMVAGFGAIARKTTTATGPSSIVELCGHDEMAATSAAMLEAFGATGFIGFDFMIEARTGHAYLIECNPRPIQIGHLGDRIGINLCEALAAAMHGADVSPKMPARADTVALFPQEWNRSPETVAALPVDLDIPWDDPKLLKAMVAMHGA